MIDKCKSTKNINTHIIWINMTLLTERSGRPNIYFAIMVPNTMQPYLLNDCYSTLGHNDSTRLYYFTRRHYYWKMCHQHCNKYISLHPECQQVTLKEPQYSNLHLPIPQFPMSFISMDLVGPYRETENGNQYAFMVYIFLIYIRSKVLRKSSRPISQVYTPPLEVANTL